MKKQLAIGMVCGWLLFVTPLLSMEYANDNNRLIDYQKSVDEQLWDAFKQKSKEVFSLCKVKVSKFVQENDSIFNIENIESSIAKTNGEANQLFKQIWERSLWTSLKKIDEQIANHKQHMQQNKGQSLFPFEPSTEFHLVKSLELEQLKKHISNQLKEL